MASRHEVVKLGCNNDKRTFLIKNMVDKHPVVFNHQNLSLTNAWLKGMFGEKICVLYLASLHSRIPLSLFWSRHYNAFAHYSFLRRPRRVCKNVGRHPSQPYSQ